ncbi:hypothetical protein ACFXKD_27700 [Nocardiopsis aegyptia]|uniref:hypothetical protein n=1 Tax=Nocardiopsis aegyptia TaxID=220378 RepID=UPI003670A9FF
MATDTRLRALPSPPDYVEHGGRRVTWEPWRLYHVMCLPARVCDGCGSSAEAYCAPGLVHPLPGDTVTVTRPRPSARVPGRSWEQEVEVPMWPAYGLIAFACPDCDHVDVYDTDGGFARVDTAQPTLF